jgi:tellurite resistance protein TerC
MCSIVPGWIWLIFFLFIGIVLLADIGLLNRKKSIPLSIRQALGLVFMWALSAVIFDGAIWSYLFKTSGLAFANQKALEFLTGYIIEQSLSVDNMFVFLMIFTYFAVPVEYQRRVLLYGVLGAVIMRLLVIVSGIWLVNQFHWVLYVFGAFLVLTGIKMLCFQETEVDLSQNLLLSWLRRHLRMTSGFYREKFFVKQNRLWYATPLFFVLVLIEISDIIFAMDSIPAIFAITRDPFIVFTSNIFAILGLRALYFVLTNMAARFHLLKYGVAVVLILIGVKMLLMPWVTVPVLFTLAAVAGVLLTTVVLSLLMENR